jgi:hypothetical protein
MSNKPKDHWTKAELTLRLGPIELAKAVIEQWVRDGKPKADEQAIKYWQGVIRECELNKTN